MANETLTPLMEDPPTVARSTGDRTLLPGAAGAGVGAVPAKDNPFDPTRFRESIPGLGATWKPTTVFPSADSAGAQGTHVTDTPTERYEYQRLLGVGGYGEVDLIRDRDIDRLVARKRLKADLLYPEAVGRFAREVRIVGQLEHPGVVPVHDVGLDEHGYFFLMKFVEGETLEDIVNRLKSADPDYDSKYTFEARTQIFMQVLRTMQFAHEHGIIHRDIKPANVMVGKFGEVLVLDWGIARPLGTPDTALPRGVDTDPRTSGERKAPASARATAEGWLMGTPAFMSPEQARGDNRSVDARSDVYALCALFYELLTLEHYLTPKATTEELLAAIAVEEPLGAVAVHHQYGVPPELTFAIRKGLAKDPADRYQSVAELLDRLQSVVEGRGPVMCPCTGLKRTGGAYSRFINRRPIAAVTVAVLATGLALVGMADVVARLVALAR